MLDGEGRPAGGVSYGVGGDNGVRSNAKQTGKPISGLVGQDVPRGDMMHERAPHNNPDNRTTVSFGGGFQHASASPPFAPERRRR